MKIKSIKNSNINIKKVLSQNEIIWQGYYTWGKYKLKTVEEVVGSFDEFKSDSYLEERYPQYYKFETITPELGKYLVYGYRKVKGDHIEDVKAKNKNEYPSNGYKGSYWYEFIE